MIDLEKEGAVYFNPDAEGAMHKAKYLLSIEMLFIALHMRADNIIILTKAMKQQLANDAGKSYRTIQDSIYTLCKQDLIQRICNNTYKVNTDYYRHRNYYGEYNG